MDNKKEVNKMLGIMQQMYMEAFPEDTQRYVTYFFNNKLKASGGGFIYKTYDDILPSMLALVKKPLVYNVEDPLTNEKIERNIDVFCIDAVTTKKEYRHKGYMERLFSEVLFEKLDQTKIPFLMLYTHMPKYYNKYGFKQCFSYYKLTKKEQTDDIELVPTGDIQSMIKLYNEGIAADLKTFRNYQTMSNRLDELMHEDGKSYFIKQNGKTMGYCLISGNNEVDEIIYNGDYSDLETSELANYDNLPLYNTSYDDANNGFMIKIMNPVEFFKILKFKITNVKVRFKLKRRFLKDTNLEIEIRNYRASKIKIIEDDVKSTIDEMDLIEVLAGGQTENQFLKSINPLDMFFLERF